MTTWACGELSLRQFSSKNKKLRCSIICLHLRDKEIQNHSLSVS